MSVLNIKTQFMDFISTYIWKIHVYGMCEFMRAMRRKEGEFEANQWLFDLKNWYLLCDDFCDVSLLQLLINSLRNHISYTYRVARIPAHMVYAMKEKAK